MALTSPIDINEAARLALVDRRLPPQEITRGGCVDLLVVISRVAAVNDDDELRYRRIWRFQNVYTDAMASAYRQQNMHQVLEDEAERAALTEALLDGRNITDYSVWVGRRVATGGVQVVVTGELGSDVYRQSIADRIGRKTRRKSVRTER